MSHIKNIAKVAIVSAGLGLATLGVGAGMANASPVTSGPGIAAWGGGGDWGHHGGGGWGGGGGGWRGGGPGWGGGGPGWGGAGWGGGWGGPPPPCISGPLGFVSVCA